MKTCRICNAEKTLAEFPKKPRNRDGLANKCKTCMARYKNDLKKREPEKWRAYRRAYYAARRALLPVRERPAKPPGREYRNNVCRESARRTARELTDGYIRRLLCSHGIGIPAALIPDSLVGAKRAQMQLARQARQLGKQHENEKSYGGSQ